MAETAVRATPARRLPHIINWPLWSGGAIVLFVLFLAVAGPFLAPRDPLQETMAIQVGDDWLGPPFPPLVVPGFPLGSDMLGRDLLSQLLWAIRPTLTVVLVAAMIRLVIGTVLGAVAGWARGWLSTLLDTTISAALAVPLLIVALATLAALGVESGAWPFILGLSITGWAETARIVREQTRVIKGQTYIEAARALGGSVSQIVARHVLRQLSPFLWVLFAFEVGATLAILAALGFLGYYLGGEIWIYITDRTAQRFSGTPELGQMLSGTIGTLYQGPWRAFAAGTMIFIIILGFNLLGEGLRLQLNPEQSYRRTLPSRAGARLTDWFGQKILEPLYVRFDGVQTRGALMGTLAAIFLVAGIGWWRAHAAPATEGLPVPGGHSWATARRDPYGTLAAGFEGPGSATILWRFQAPGGLTGGPAVAADGRLYVASRERVLYALDSSGSVEWEVSLPAVPVGSPALDGDGRLYIADESGGLSAWSPRGEQEWYFQPPEMDAATSGPVVAPTGEIYYSVGASVQAVSAFGDPLWRARLLDDPIYQPPQLSPSGEWLLLGNRIVRAEDGSSVTGLVPEGVEQVTIGSDGGLYVGTEDAVLGQWEFVEGGARHIRDVSWPGRGRFVSSPSDFGLTHDRIFWVAYDFHGVWDAKIAWVAMDERLLGVAAFPHRPMHVIGTDSASRLYTCGMNRMSGPECLAYSIGAETPLWQLPLRQGGPVIGGALAPGRLYVATESGMLYAIGEEE